MPRSRQGDAGLPAGAGRGAGTAVQAETCCQPANAQPSATIAASQPDPIRTLGAMVRMPGIHTPSAADTITRREGHHRNQPQLRRAPVPTAWRRSSARSASSARARSASICERSRSIRARSRSNASLSAATTTPASRVSSCPSGPPPGGRRLQIGFRPPEAARHLNQPADRIEHAHPLTDAHKEELMESPARAQARRGSAGRRSAGRRSAGPPVAGSSRPVCAPLYAEAA